MCVALFKMVLASQTWQLSMPKIFDNTSNNPKSSLTFWELLGFFRKHQSSNVFFETQTEPVNKICQLYENNKGDFIYTQK